MDKKAGDTMNIVEENKKQIHNMHTNFKNLRTEQGLTIAQLSEQTQIAEKDLLATESGQDFEISILIRLCRFYKIKPRQIFAPPPVKKDT